MEFVKNIALIIVCFGAIIFCSIISIKKIMEIINYIKTEKDYGKKCLLGLFCFMFLFPVIIYIFDYYDLPTKFHLTNNLISNSTWLDFISSYIGMVIGTLISSIILLIVTRMQINKTFENERKKDEMVSYNKEIALLNLYKEVIKEMRENIDTCFNWLNAMKQKELKTPDGEKVDVYLMSYSDFMKIYWINIAEKELQNLYSGVNDEFVVKSIIDMMGKVKDVATAFHDELFSPLVNNPLNREIKAQKRKAIEEDINKGNTNSILNVLNNTEKIIENRKAEVKNEIKKIFEE